MFKKPMAVILAAYVSFGLLSGCGAGGTNSGSQTVQSAQSSSDLSSESAGLEALKSNDLVSLQAFTTLTFYGNSSIR